MKIICLLASFFLFSFFLTGCEVCSCKKIPCPEFNAPEFLHWLPYTSSQKIVFRNNSLFDTITIDRIDKSASYEASKGCLHGDNGCTMNYWLSSAEAQPDYTPKFSVDFMSTTPFESSNASKNIALRFYNFTCAASGVDDQGLLIEPGAYSSQYYASFNMAGNIYNNVQVIIKDTSGSTGKTSGPYKIYLAKDQGMVGYEHYPGLQTWIKE